MSLGDTIGYLVFDNPFSQTVISTISSIAKSSGLPLKPKQHSPDVPLSSTVSLKLPRLCELAGKDYTFVRLAGICGASAVIMGAYGKHCLGSIVDMQEKAESQAIFDTANRFHFLHTFALMAMPLARKPMLTGTLMVTGTLLFSGPMYYRALTGDKTFVHLATCGGFCLIAAWLTLIL